MIINLAILLLAWFGGYYILDLDFARYYALAVGYFSDNAVILLISATLGLLTFVAVAFSLGETGFYSLMKLLGKALFELSRSVIYCICLAAVIFSFQLNVNLWRDLGITAVIPFEAFLASCLALYLFDFNYPIGERLLENLGAAVLSGLIVFASGFFQ